MEHIHVETLRYNILNVMVIYCYLLWLPESLDSRETFHLYPLCWRCAEPLLELGCPRGSVQELTVSGSD